MNTKIALISSLCFSLLVTSACSVGSIAMGTLTGTGLAAAQHRGVGDAIDDFTIQTKINDLWFRQDVDSFGKLDITVNQGRVLLTGVVQDPDQRLEAVRLAWQPQGVKQVINEIRVAESSGVKGYAKDAWISSRLRTKLTFDEEILSINYSIDTVEGVVYLLGLAKSRQELNRVTEIAQTISGVQKVVSYVRVVEGIKESTAVEPDYLEEEEEHQMDSIEFKVERAASGNG
ncbi:MAG: BON domain-containing protein [Pseudomonadota bacterium]